MQSVRLVKSTDSLECSKVTTRQPSVAMLFTQTDVPEHVCKLSEPDWPKVTAFLLMHAVCEIWTHNILKLVGLWLCREDEQQHWGHLWRELRAPAKVWAVPNFHLFHR